MNLDENKFPQTVKYFEKYKSLNLLYIIPIIGLTIYILFIWEV